MTSKITQYVLAACCCFLFFFNGTGSFRSPANSKTISSDAATTGNELLIDSDMSLEEALQGKDLPLQIKESLSIIDVEYYSMDKKLHKGQIVVNKLLAKDLKEVFQEIKESKFPINKVVPIVKYYWSDSLSMLDNNTSCFNYRRVKGTKILSAHAKGRGIDINPYLNPQIKNGKPSPAKAEYNIKNPGTITESSIIVKAFKIRGWKWGGNWRSTKDYQHFEKK